MINQVCYDCLSYPRILLVEHDVAIRESMQDVLKDSGYDITAVGDAEAAVERLAQQPAFDLLISDVGLPGMSGHDLAKHAMARHPSVTVLLVTGHGGVPGADPHFLENDVMLLKELSRCWSCWERFVRRFDGFQQQLGHSSFQLPRGERLGEYLHARLKLAGSYRDACCIAGDE